MVTDVDIFLISILPRIYLTHARISCKSIKSNFGDNDGNKKFHQLFLGFTSKEDIVLEIDGEKNSLLEESKKL